MTVWERGLRLPEELGQSVDVWLPIYIFDPHYPGMPVHVAVGIGARVINGIEILLIGEFDRIARAAIFKLVTVECIRLVETLH